MKIHWKIFFSDSHTSIPPHLQRIVSRCKCEFYHVSYGDESAAVAAAAATPGGGSGGAKAPPVAAADSHQSIRAAGVLEEPNKYVNCFSLIHHDLNVSTNSLQYSVVLDVLNSILLFVDPAGMKRSDIAAAVQAVRTAR